MLRNAEKTAIFAALGLGLAPVLFSNAHAADKRPAPVAQAQGADACTEVRGSVRLEAYGYTHVVSLKNGCDKPVECALWSNVDPEPRTIVQLLPGARTEIITRRGSPAREVTGMKSCRYR